MKPWILGAALGLTLAPAAASSFVLQETPTATERKLRITAGAANVRSAPSPSARVLFQLKKDQTVTLLATEGAWHRVQDDRGRRGYVFNTLGEVIEPPPPPAPEAKAPPAPQRVDLAIEHKEVSCVIAEQYPKVDTCLLPGENVGRAYVHFRALDTEPWYAVELAREGPCYAAYLPKPMRSTREIRYYLDVVDRAMTERQHPDRGPDAAYRARVVRKEGDCEGLKRIAYAVGKVARPIVVAVARTAAGAKDPAALAAIGQLLLAGFRPEGVILAATGAAPATATAAVSGGAGGGGGGAAGGAGGAAGGGGIGMGTIAAVAGAVAAVGVGAAVAGGGGDGNGGGGGGGGGGATPPPAPVSLTGTWTGSMMLTGTVSGFGTLNCNYSQVRLDITHTGGSVSGTASFPSVTCNIPGAAPIASQGGSSPFTGTASGGQVRLSFPDSEGVCPPFHLDGTYTNNAMSGNAPPYTCTDLGVTVNLTATWSATR